MFLDPIEFRHVMTLKEGTEHSHVTARRFMLVRGYGVVAPARRGACSACAIQRRRWRENCYFPNLLRVRVEVVCLMVNSPEDHYPVLKQQVMGRFFG